MNIIQEPLSDTIQKTIDAGLTQHSKDTLKQFEIQAPVCFSIKDKNKHNHALIGQKE